MAKAKEEAKKVELRVKRRHHTFGGKTYKTGEKFMGTDKMLKAMPDRLELASVSAGRAADAAKSADMSKALKEAEKSRDLYKDAADKAQAELGEVKADLEEAKKQLEELTKAPDPKGTGNGNSANGK